MIDFLPECCQRKLPGAIQNWGLVEEAPRIKTDSSRR